MKRANWKAINGTALVGEINVSYKKLVSVFGPDHDGAYDDYKSDAGWEIEFEDGTVATIYNWKNGKNYCGENGLDKAEITHWNVGGKNFNALLKIEQALAN